MQEGRFVLKSPFKPQGDQPQAIEALAQGVQSGMPCQVLLGVTGSGKTYTMASVIERVQRPTLVIAHNKTLAAQLCAEFREFFPDSAVEYFVSYYDIRLHRYLYRKGFRRQRGDRAPAPQRDGGAARAAGCDRRRLGVVHLLDG